MIRKTEKKANKNKGIFQILIDFLINTLHDKIIYSLVLIKSDIKKWIDENILKKYIFKKNIYIKNYFSFCDSNCDEIIVKRERSC